MAIIEKNINKISKSQNYLKNPVESVKFNHFEGILPNSGQKNNYMFLIQRPGHLQPPASKIFIAFPH